MDYGTYISIVDSSIEVVMFNSCDSYVYLRVGGLQKKMYFFADWLVVFRLERNTGRFCTTRHLEVGVRKVFPNRCSARCLTQET